MAFEFHLPDIGEGVVEGEIVSWKVAVGDKIELDQPMVEVMTDKATVEIPSPRAGTVAQINFNEGDICQVGEVLIVIDEGAAAQNEPKEQPTTVSAEAAPAAQSVGNSSQSAPAPVEQTARAVVSPAIQVVDGIASTGGRKRVLATPATRRIARQFGVDIALVPATGKRGRVTSDDVRLFASSAQAEPSPPSVDTARGSEPGRGLDLARGLDPARKPESAPLSELAPAIAMTRQGEEERIPFRGMRKRIADNMSRSKRTAAHFTYVEEIDMTELYDVRARARERAVERGFKLTYLPFIVKAIVSGLKKWPKLNAALDETSQEIVVKKYYHIGIATQGPHGLMVTVVRDADKRSIFDLAREIDRLAQAVRDGTIKRDELVGSTFTITSLGKLGGVMATPIINFPEVGIVGVHKMEQRPAVRNGEIVIRWLMNLSISVDHRLADGWDGAMFLQDVKSLLEDPTTMFMEMV